MEVPDLEGEFRGWNWSLCSNFNPQRDGKYAVTMFVPGFYGAGDFNDYDAHTCRATAETPMLALRGAMRIARSKWPVKDAS